MRFRTLEIRWHDSKPISTCDFQTTPFKKIKEGGTVSYRLATGGEDNHVRIWMVYPNIISEETTTEASTSNAPRQPRVEYLATLSRHSAAVNVVRFSPNGELIASAGDDGMIIIWASTQNPQAAAYGSDLTQEDMQYEKEHWKPRITFRCTTMQVYDLAWSPTGEYLIAGSTDNCARVFASADGKCVHEIAEHNHYVQGVAWDPLNEYIATQSSDRSMHIFRISTKPGQFEAHAIGKNVRIRHRHTRTPSSSSRPRPVRRESTSDVESVMSEQPDINPAPLTPAASVASAQSSFAFPAPSTTDSSSRHDASLSRRSSFSAPDSPQNYTRFGRSPSPMPALPAIRPPMSPNSWTTVKLYGDENFTNFFRRLTFSPDGGLLLTPAGQFEDPSFHPKAGSSKPDDVTRGRSTSKFAETSVDPTSASSVFIYSRANFARPPIAQLPGHKKASIAVRFSPLLYDLRETDAVSASETQKGTIRKESEGELPLKSKSGANIAKPSGNGVSSPTHSNTEPKGLPTPVSHSPTPVTPATGSVFALPYRMMFAVVTMDTVAIYDTQQAGPVALLTKLHYDEFTDMTWSQDGKCLMLSARDGYCTMVIFDEHFPAYHTQQQTIQMQSIAHNHSIPLVIPTTPSLPASSAPPTPASTAKRSEKYLSPPMSVDGQASSSSAVHDTPTSKLDDVDRPKKKRRVALTRVGDIDTS